MLYKWKISRFVLLCRPFVWLFSSIWFLLDWTIAMDVITTSSPPPNNDDDSPFNISQFVVVVSLLFLSVVKTLPCWLASIRSDWHMAAMTAQQNILNTIKFRNTIDNQFHYRTRFEPARWSSRCDPSSTDRPYRVDFELKNNNRNWTTPTTTRINATQ